jgi:hypothetical protein
MMISAACSRNSPANVCQLRSKSKVIEKIHTEIRLRCYRIECVCQFVFIDVDGNLSAFEFLQATGVVEVEMPHHHSLDIFDFVACLLDLLCRAGCFLTFKFASNSDRTLSQVSSKFLHRHPYSLCL